MAGESSPHDAPRLGHIRLLEFHRGEEAIAAGHACVTPMLSVLQRVLSPAGAD